MYIYIYMYGTWFFVVMCPELPHAVPWLLSEPMLGHVGVMTRFVRTNSLVIALPFADFSDQISPN